MMRTSPVREAEERPSFMGEASAPAILIVDDNAANLLAFEAILKPLAQPMLKAHSGQEALRHLLQHEIALVLLDVQMPEMNGFEVASLMRSHTRVASVPIIFVTALNRDPSHVFAGYAHGAVDYLLKPFDPEILRAKVNVFLELHRRQEKIREQAARLHRHELREIERRNQERFRGLTESMPLPVWGVKPDGRVYVCNGAWTEYSGLTADETGELANTRSMHPDDVTPARAQWTEATGRAEPFDFECRLQRKRDGMFRWHLLRAVPERGDRALDGFWIVAGIDVDAQKTAEHERARLLERERGAREQAEAANRMKDEFLATISHELRTPLNAILGWARIIRTGALDSKKLLQAVETIERSAHTQARLVNDILDVSRIVTGKLRIQVTPIDMRTVVTDAVDTVRPAAGAKNIELRWSPPEAAVMLSGDPARLQQVVWNLVSNAVKFTPKGGSVAITLEDRGDSARVAVVDDGPGIAPEFLPFVFDRFRQGDATVARAHEGLGLGLSIVKSIVEIHGGLVTAESGGVGGGATFTVTLPLRGRAEVAPTRTEAEVFPAPRLRSVPQTDFPRLEGASILFVDDRPEARELVAELLTHCGARVRCADTARAALDALAEQVPDVLISDIGLPDEDGYALIRRVRGLEDPAARSVPAVALTAFARPEDERRAKDEGFHVHLAKPVEPDELVQLVASLIARRSVSEFVRTSR